MIQLRVSFVGLITGNTYVMKPSERDPTACMALVELLRDAGAPDGTVNVIHGHLSSSDFFRLSTYLL